MYNPLMDPYERADITSDQYHDWTVYMNIQGQIRAIDFMETFKDYPPSQFPASFSIDPEGILKILERQKAAMAGGK